MGHVLAMLKVEETHIKLQMTFRWAAGARQVCVCILEAAALRGSLQGGGTGMADPQCIDPLEPLSLPLFGFCMPSASRVACLCACRSKKGFVKRLSAQVLG